jgi:SSS family solute:Na+ symporter/sodium/pantothenate symporter
MSEAGIMDLSFITDRPLIWGLFVLYLVATSALAYIGHKKTTDIKSFAVGAGDMNPIIVGITLAASIASTATFVINPGFVYVHGMSAVMHLGVAAGSGIVIGLLVMSLGFRRVGKKTAAVTLPQWVGQRYKSQAMTIFFACVNLLSLTFVVLIVGGLSIVMQQTLGLSNLASVALIIGFVFSYIFVGGTYAHAYTNTLQGVIMVFIAGIIVASGLHFFADGFTPIAERLTTVDPNLVKSVNPASPLYGSFFSVWICGFVIGFALVSQPHIMIKALYVENDSDVWKYLGVCILVSIVFTALLLVGIYAHMMEMPRDAFINPKTGDFRQDMVMAVYITKTFSPTMVAVIMVALMAAGMSTLDGILIALSSIAANDLFLNLTRDNILKDKTEDEQNKIAHHAGQGILVALGVITFIIALNPPELLGIFGQLGVYGIVAASLTPILAGILFQNIHRYAVLGSSIAALLVHFGLYGAYYFTKSPDLISYGFANPGVTATWGILASVLIALPAGLLTMNKSSDGEEAALPEAA